MKRKVVKHKHVGPIDYVCTNCFPEVQEVLRSEERHKTVAGLVLLICFVIASVAVVAYYLTKHGSHLQ